MYKKQKSISEYNPNEPFSDIFVVRFTKEIRSTKNGKYFFEIKIQDSNGDGMLKYWGSNNLQNVEKLYDLIKEDSVIFAEGSVTEYNGNIDFSVNEGKIKVLKIGEYNPSDFIKVSKRDKEEMFTELKAHMDSIINPELKQVLNVFFSNEKFVEKFKTAPGAMYIHHGWISGLLEHTLTVLNICLNLQKYHEDVDRDLLITGAILHDIGKTDEFVITTQIKITDKGNLLSHIIMGVQELTRVLDKLDISEITKTKLLHIMISHHGKVEYGCPKPHMIPEALIIAKADEIDANIVAMLEAKKTAGTNDSFTYSKHIGNIYLK
ncbi:MAG: HD domain-containing protein [Candidatus ainarchaeum sp.]|nr:HD domain-containing protein [Candidatus ainarchaeum sp.]